jgi:FkbM family methyltransferase
MSRSGDPEIERLRRDLDEAREVNRQWKARYAERRRRVLDPDVIRQIVPRRIVTARALAESVDARTRHDQMLRRSESYRAALDDPSPHASHLLHTTVDGVSWWAATPRPDAHAANERMIAKQSFPYRAMTQTRELAIGGIMLDIGANIGQSAVPRVIAGDVAAVYCAEPDPVNYACLMRNVSDNGLHGLVLPDRVAITAAPGPVRLFLGKQSGAHSIVPEAGAMFANAGATGALDVEGVTLDAWVARLGIDLRLVTFVKVDTQGAEPQVLAGAPAVLSNRHVAWQIEIAPDLLEMAGSSVRDLLQQLERSFTHLIDLSGRAPGDRVLPMSGAAEALSYLAPPGHTDVLVFNAG